MCSLVVFVRSARHEDLRTGLQTADVAAAVAFREKTLKERQAEADAEASKGISPSVTARDMAADDGDADGYTAEVDDDDDADEHTALMSSQQPKKRKATKAAKASAEMSGVVAGRAFSIDPLAPSSAFDETLRDKLREDVVRKRQGADVEDAVDEDEDDEEAPGEGPGPSGVDPNERLLERHWTAPAGKRIAVPVRIEPKVYFAAERTFLVRTSPYALHAHPLTCVQKWLHFAIYIGTIATLLLNFTAPDDRTGLVSAGLFTFAALASIAYSAAIFVYRAMRLRKRRAEGMYYDKYGPTVLSAIVLAALGTNIWLRMRELVG